jgi:hypothetical protein
VTGRWVVWATAAVLGSVAAVLYLDPILAAFVTILLLTGGVMAFLARDWDRHSTYEERELERSRRRAGKWERGKAARDRDRARWNAHQARQGTKKSSEPEL